MAAVTARILLVAVALVAIVVSAFWLSDTHRLLSAQAHAAAAKTPAQLRAAADAFPADSPLTPDTDAKAAQAYAFLRAGEPARAEPLLENVLRREPRNV